MTSSLSRFGYEGIGELDSSGFALLVAKEIFILLGLVLYPPVGSYLVPVM